VTEFAATELMSKSREEDGGGETKGQEERSRDSHKQYFINIKIKRQGDAEEMAVGRASIDQNGSCKSKHQVAYLIPINNMYSINQGPGASPGRTELRKIKKKEEKIINKEKIKKKKIRKKKNKEKIKNPAHHRGGRSFEK